jgi:hypothetical protein
LRCELISTSGGNRKDRKKGQVLDATPMKLPSGQMTFVGAQFDAISLCGVEGIYNSLFKTWTYSHRGSSLRLTKPGATPIAHSPEGSSTELGSSALCGLGLLAFTMSEARPDWRMVAYTGRRSEGKIYWPIWDAQGGAGASLQMIVAMLRALSSDALQDHSIRNLVRMVASARRYVLDPTQGDYGNITRAEFSFPTESS